MAAEHVVASLVVQRYSVRLGGTCNLTHDCMQLTASAYHTREYPILMVDDRMTFACAITVLFYVESSGNDV